MKYLVISRLDDEVHVEILQEHALKERLEAEEDGYRGFDILRSCPEPENFPGRSLFIFRGEVVIPKPKTVVTEYDL